LHLIHIRFLKFLRWSMNNFGPNCIYVLQLKGGVRSPTKEALHNELESKRVASQHQDGDNVSPSSLKHLRHESCCLHDSQLNHRWCKWGALCKTPISYICFLKWHKNINGKISKHQNTILYHSLSCYLAKKVLKEDRLKLNMFCKCTLFPGRFIYFTMGNAWGSITGQHGWDKIIKILSIQQWDINVSLQNYVLGMCLSIDHSF